MINVLAFNADCHGERKYCECNVGEYEGKLVGYVLYYFTYSTFEGKSMYMEDLYISPEYRNQNIGTKLWKSVVQVRKILQIVHIVIKLPLTTP